MTTNRWLTAYAKTAKWSDIFVGRPDHARLIAAGLFGEAGSVLAEVKKRQREEDVYPGYLDSLGEELGDSLWYFVRLADLLDRPLLESIARERARASRRPALNSALDLGAAAGRIISALGLDERSALREALLAAWTALERVARAAGTTLEQAADENLRKTRNRWPRERARRGWPRPADYYPLFDSGVPPEDRLPRDLEIEFHRTQARRAQADRSTRQWHQRWLAHQRQHYGRGSLSLSRHISSLICGISRVVPGDSRLAALQAKEQS